MPIITFKPSGKTVTVPDGTELLDAAREADISIDSPCGGKGTCGKCIVRIVSGEVDFENQGVLTAAAVAKGFILTCKTKVKGSPVTIEIPEQSDKESGQFIDETNDIGVDRKYYFSNKQGPLTGKFFIDVPLPQLEDGLSDLDRLICSVQELKGEKEVRVPLPVIREIAGTLRAENGKVTVSLTETPGYVHISRIEPGESTYGNWGIAVDIGTTTVAIQLVDLVTAEVLSTRTDYNAQIQCGLDVISRINYAQKPERLDELRRLVLETVNGLIHQVCSGNDIAPDVVGSAAISGNTTMVHLLLGLPPEHIRLEPYTPTILAAPFLNAGETGISIHAHAPVHISPSVGSYVGGDITAGLLCTEIAAGTGGINLFLDIGTNGELVIGNQDFLVTCACSAGPAFEGGGIGSGMRAALGAIENVDIDPQNGTPICHTIGSVPSRGICGTGMISLLANLFLTGWLDPAGKLNRSKPCPAIEINGRQARYILVPAEESGTGKAIIINETDIENIIRAKAAIYSACALMLEQVGMRFDALANIYIAGGFGRFLDIEKAVTIGLLPDLPRERYRYIGNSSLMGSYLVLVSGEYRNRQQELARRMTYMELSTEPNYMNQYTGALFLPHTDTTQFPSINSRKLTVNL